MSGPPDPLSKLKLNRRKCQTQSICLVNEKGMCSLIFRVFGLSTFSPPTSQWARDAHKLICFIIFLAASPLAFLSPDVVGRHVTGPQPYIRSTLVLAVLPSV